jgi:hypothetical protein
MRWSVFFVTEGSTYPCTPSPSAPWGCTRRVSAGSQHRCQRAFPALQKARRTFVRLRFLRLGAARVMSVLVPSTNIYRTSSALPLGRRTFVRLPSVRLEDARIASVLVPSTGVKGRPQRCRRLDVLLYAFVFRALKTHASRQCWFPAWVRRGESGGFRIALCA